MEGAVVLSACAGVAAGRWSGGAILGLCKAAAAAPGSGGSVVASAVPGPLPRRQPSRPRRGGRAGGPPWRASTTAGTSQVAVRELPSQEGGRGGRRGRWAL